MRVPNTAEIGATAAVARVLCAGVVAAVGWLYAERLIETDFDYVLWTDRDLARARAFPEELPVEGPEVSGGGGRLPGGFLYAFLWGVLALTDDPAGVYRVLTGLEFAGFALLALVVGRAAGPVPGAVTLAVAATLPAVVETLERLWNPSLLPPMAVLQLLAAWDAVGSRPVRGAALLGLVTALGAQAHASALLFGAGLLVGVVVVVGRREPRVLGAAAAGLVLGYLPYVVVEATRGFENTRVLLAGGDDMAQAPWPDMLRGLLSQFTLGALGSGQGIAWTNLLHLGGIGALAAGAGRGRQVTRPWVVVAAAGAGAFLAFYGVGGGPSFVQGWEGRYVLPAVPAVAALVGLGWGELAARLPTRAARHALWTGLAGMAASAALGVALPDRPASYEAWHDLRFLLGAVRAETGWSLVELTGRTSVWTHGSDGWTSRANRGIAYLLDGEPFPGSLSAPCAFVLRDYERPAPVDGAFLEEVVQRPLPGVRVEREVALDRLTRLVLVHLDEPCPATFVQRYVPTEPERRIAAAWSALEKEWVREERLPDGRRVLVRLPVARGWEDHLGLAVDLRVGDGSVAATLHGGQLRGHAYNDGLLGNVRVRRPRLLLTDPAGEEVELVWAEGLVGGTGALVPLHVARPVPPGTWRVDLALTTVPWDDAPGRELRIVLVEALGIPDVSLRVGSAPSPDRDQ